jgi:putative transcriptional regulator
MIINHLSEIMGRKRLKVTDVVKHTGLARNTVTEIFHARSKRVDMETLDKLCAFLGVSVGDIFEHVEESEKEPPQG